MNTTISFSEMLAGGCSHLASSRISVNLILCVIAIAHSAEPEVQTSFGKVVGKRIQTLGGNCERYAGIPYAEKPLGQLRFEKPVPWSASYEGGALNAFQYKDVCVQADAGTRVRGSEDCLYLNIFKAESQAIALLPVMLWIHGGSFQRGGSDWPLPNVDMYDGCDLAISQNVIVVATNYRLGPWGFLTTKSDSGNGIDANIGLEDQREAMRWVKQQATSLGGNPDSITIFGESAGSMSVALHAISHLSAGLFRHAIAESGSACTQPVDDALTTSKGLATRLGCTLAKGSSIKQCLRNFTTQEILENAQEHAAAIFEPHATLYFPVVDGRNFREHPATLLLKNQINPNVTVIMGTNTDEATLFWFPPVRKTAINRTSYDFIVRQMSTRFTGFSNAQVKRVLDAYPGSDNRDNRGQLATFTTDFAFLCMARFFAENHPLTYVYRFDHSPAWLPKYLGVPHGIELPYVFGKSRKTAEEAAMSDEMEANWGHLAHFGTPRSHVVGPSWPAWDAAAEQNVHFTSKFAMHHTFDVEASYRAEQCHLFSELWREVYGVSRKGKDALLV